MASIFTKIIDGELSCHKIYEDEKHLSFLDIRPIRAGHCLVIPKKEVDYIFDMEDGELAELVCVAKKVAKAVQKAIPCKKIGMTVIGIEVPHTHIHLMPIDAVGDFDFSKAKNGDQDQLKELALKISSHLS